MLACKHQLPLSSHSRLLLSIGLKMQPCFLSYPYSLLPLLLVNILLAIFRAFAHQNQTHSLHSNVVPNNSVAKLPIFAIKIPLLFNLYSLIVPHLPFSPHQSTPPLLMSQPLIGTKIHVSSTSVMPSRHWAGFVHDKDTAKRKGEHVIGWADLLVT